MPPTPACLHSFLALHGKHDSLEQAKTLLDGWFMEKLMSEVGALAPCPAHHIHCPYMQLVSASLLPLPSP